MKSGGVTFVEVQHDRPERRRLYRLSVPIRFSQSVEVPYDRGEKITEYVVVSCGRYGDTVIFPASHDGRILDFLGFNGRMGWDSPEVKLQEWLDGATYGAGCGLTFEQVRADR